MNKSVCKLLLVAAISLSGPTKADEIALPQKPQTQQPFTLTTPFNQQDEKKVLVYFKYDCPYCREYHAMLSGWGQTLPAGYSLEFVPVLETDTAGLALKKNMVPFVLYESMERIEGIGPGNLQAFSERAYAIEQDGPKKPSGDDAEWRAAVHKAGVAGVDIVNISANSGRWIPALVERQAHYQLRETPTMVICGKYEVTPAITNGDHALFLQLINGVMSKCLIEQGVKQAN